MDAHEAEVIELRVERDQLLDACDAWKRDYNTLQNRWLKALDDGRESLEALARERESRKQAEAELREAHGYLLASGFDGTMVMKRINAALAIPQEPAEPESGK